MRLNIRKWLSACFTWMKIRATRQENETNLASLLHKSRLIVFNLHNYSFFLGCNFDLPSVTSMTIDYWSWFKPYYMLAKRHNYSESQFVAWSSNYKSLQRRRKWQVTHFLAHYVSVCLGKRWINLNLFYLKVKRDVTECKSVFL